MKTYHQLNMRPRPKLLAMMLVAISQLATCGGPEIEPPGAMVAADPVSTQTVRPSEPRRAQQPDAIARPDEEPQPETVNNRFAAAGIEALDVLDRGVREISWEDLWPAGEEERLTALYQAQMAQLYAAPVAEGSAGDVAVQIGTFNTVEGLDQTLIRIPGYTVPFDFSPDADITEFLLVPYFGACLHAPPPPPNQTIFVETATPIKLADLAQAVWIEGTISAQRQDTALAGAAYTVQMHDIEEFQY